MRNRGGRFTAISDPAPGVANTQLVDINNRGWIVGFYYETMADVEQGISHGFLRRRNGGVTRIDVPGAELTRPFRANERGRIAGHYADGRSLHGFVWEDGKVTTIDVPGAVATILYGINNRGEMVGAYIDDKGAYHGFLRKRRGAIRTLDAPGAAPTHGGPHRSGSTTTARSRAAPSTIGEAGAAFSTSEAGSPPSTPPAPRPTPDPSTSTTAAGSSATTTSSRRLWSPCP